MYTQQQQKPKKPVFSDPPDQSTTNVNYIMTTLQKQQQQIIKLLGKYKDTIPDDQQLEFQHNRQSLTERNIYQRKNQQKIMKKSKASRARSNKKQMSMNIDDIRAVYGGGGGSQFIRYSKNNTIAYDKKYQQYPPATKKNRTISVKKRKESFNLDTSINNNQKDNNKYKLPFLNKKYNSHNNKIGKSVQDQKYQKVQQNYNENVIKFYQNVSKNNANNPNQLPKAELKNLNLNRMNVKRDRDSKLRNKDKNKKVEKNYKINMNNNQLGGGNMYGNSDRTKSIQKQQNKINIEDQEYDGIDLDIQHQIAKPIAIRPYSNFSQIYAPNGQQYQKKSQSRAEKPNKKLTYDDDDKPTEVPMNYYIRIFNQKLLQQCKQQINYLYFSKADENDSNKQWAEEIIKIFDRHDEELQKIHKNMKYLEMFDQGFFTAGIYQNGGGAANGNSQYKK